MLFIPRFSGRPFGVLVAGALGGLSGPVRSVVMPAECKWERAFSFARAGPLD